MDPSPEKDRAVIVSCFVQEGLGSPGELVDLPELFSNSWSAFDVEDSAASSHLPLWSGGCSSALTFRQTRDRDNPTDFFDRSFCILGGMERGVTLLRLLVAGHAIDIRGIHQAGRVRDPDPASPPIEILRSTPTAATPVEEGGRMGQGWDLSDFMTQRRMTVGTFDS